MKKLISVDSVFVAFASAIGYGFGYAIPELLGAGVLLSTIVCMTLGSLPGALAGKIVFSKYIQEKKSRRVLSFVVILAVFLIMLAAGLVFFNYNLLTELPADLGPEIVFPILGFLASCVVRYFRRKRILRKYRDSEGFTMNDTEMQRIRDLNGENKEITGEVDRKATVVLETGTFVGKKSKDGIAYLGIPYAKAPVGELRWKAPQKAEPSEVVHEAVWFGPSEIQAFNDRSMLKEHRQSEDCLTVNVWTAKADKKSEKKPVVVYIHGGDFNYGGSANPFGSGETFVRNHPDVVFVSFNYRLNVFGFIDFSTIPGGEDYPDAANLGILDQILALEWVRDNIRAFGGDPENVTVFGDSAGASSIWMLSCSEKAKGLFRRAIVISGSPESLMPELSLSRDLGQKMAEEFSASTMQDLAGLSSEELKKFAADCGVYLSEPTCGGQLCPVNLYDAAAEGKTGEIEFIIAFSNDEISSYDSILGKEVTDQWVEPYLQRIFGGAGEKQTQEFREMIAEKEAELGNLQQAKRWFINDWYSRGSLMTLAENLHRAGKKVHCFHWDVETLVDRLGSGTVQIVPTLLGNNAAAETLGSLVNENVQLILQELLLKFIRGEDFSLSNNELKGVTAIEWAEYPAVLEVTDEKMEISRWSLVAGR